MYFWSNHRVLSNQHCFQIYSSPLLLKAHSRLIVDQEYKGIVESVLFPSFLAQSNLFVNPMVKRCVLKVFIAYTRYPTDRSPLPICLLSCFSHTKQHESTNENSLQEDYMIWILKSIFVNIIYHSFI